MNNCNPPSAPPSQRTPSEQQEVGDRYMGSMLLQQKHRQIPSRQSCQQPRHCKQNNKRRLMTATMRKKIGSAHDAEENSFSNTRQYTHARCSPRCCKEEMKICTKCIGAGAICVCASHKSCWPPWNGVLQERLTPLVQEVARTPFFSFRRKTICRKN